ncbi:ABC transporter substrate-binding protein [Streptomyces sp. NBC_01218]|uniref:ABC transporter substrate-binding protein n=1 Tax=unclassified Streptomyces TaxID=2593676 RepID=UPI0023BA025C|nr:MULTISPECIES: ABC transporter substrate-binding protein [unclassified Streptomyces]WEH43304.1 ABC transporter substrate-binding protein [Streptomyces sp. AM 2-1-1]WSQ54945.1 ABC transporter substrate-binding protein [Streptomyces sp. NBC_01218]
MAEQSGWRFSDDRGRVSESPRLPGRVLAYVQAGATLWDLGVPSWGLFGSGHDGPDIDTAKTGELPLDGVRYLGAGTALDADALLRGAPDLVVAVSYGGGQVYGLDPDAAKHLEEQVPLVVIDVGPSRTLAAISARFADLARSLGARGLPRAEEELSAARTRLRATVAGGAVPVTALSPAGPEQAYVARPAQWPELAVLEELGVGLVEPPPGPGVNWHTASWAEVAASAPRVLLTDVRVNAAPLDGLRSQPDWAALLDAGTLVVPWNPEPLCSPHAHARFLTLVADALDSVREE